MIVCRNIDAVRREQPVDGVEVVVVVAQADRLEHLDADDLVEPAGQLAIVRAQYLDACPGLADPRPPSANVAILFFADRRGRHAAAIAGRRPDGEAAPAAADLQHVIGRLRVQRPADAIDLLRLRLLERVSGRCEVAARVHQQIGVEKEPEELVAEIVVPMDMPAAAGEGIVPEAARDAAREPVQRAGEAALSLDQPGGCAASAAPAAPGPASSSRRP